MSKKPQVILVWNTHINESPATYLMAKKLNMELEKRGINTSIVKTPYKKSESFEFQQGTSAADRYKFYEFFHPTFAEKLAFESPEALVISIHCSAIETFRMNTQKLDKQWKARRMKYLTMLTGSPLPPLTLNHEQNNNYFIEFPAIMKEAPKALQELKPKSVDKTTLQGTKYFEKIVDLRATKAASVFAPIVVRKLAHLIEAEAKTRAGIFKKIKGMPWRQTRKPISNRWVVPFKKPNAEHVKRRMLKDYFKRRML